MDTLRRTTVEGSEAEDTNALQEALREESVALLEYRRVLHIFADLIVEGRIPDEGEYFRSG